MFHVMICDDDTVFCQKERRFIRAFFDRQEVAVKIDVFHTEEEIVSLGEKVSRYDAAFVGVDSEKGSGIHIGRWLGASSSKLTIVFVSDTLHYAPDGYKVGAVRYILKDEGKFGHSMEECLGYILRKSQKEDFGYVVITDEKIRISVDKILYVESRGHKITYHLVAGVMAQAEYAVYGKLDDIVEELQEFGFCRTHQSYLVNMHFVQDVERYKVVFLDGTQIQISKKYYKAVEDRFIRERGTL